MKKMPCNFRKTHRLVTPFPSDMFSHMQANSRVFKVIATSVVSVTSGFQIADDVTTDNTAIVSWKPRAEREQGRRRRGLLMPWGVICTEVMSSILFVLKPWGVICTEWY